MAEVGRRLEDFYADVMWALGEHAQSGGTAVGAGAVLKRVGLEHEVEAARKMPVPRATREEAAAQRWDRSR